MAARFGPKRFASVTYGLPCSPCTRRSTMILLVAAPRCLFKPLDRKKIEYTDVFPLIYTMIPTSR